MFTNFATAISSGTAVTLGLFYIMNLLIVIQPQALVEPRDPMELNWVRLARPEPPPRTNDARLDPKTFEPPELTRTDPTGDPGEQITVRKPRTAPPPVNEFTGTGPIIQDGPLVALVRVSPTYPARAQQSGLEGWVLVEFDVLASGAVANVIVIDSSNRMFDNAARKAAERFRFKPRVIEGVAQVTTGIQNLFTFRMEN
ncbi:MAG: TonB family protein [Gammaproteobacteria bacterium]